MTWKWKKFHWVKPKRAKNRMNRLYVYGLRSDDMMFQCNFEEERFTSSAVHDALLEYGKSYLDTFLDCACIVGRNCEKHKDIAA